MPREALSKKTVPLRVLTSKKTLPEAALLEKMPMVKAPYLKVERPSIIFSTNLHHAQLRQICHAIMHQVKHQITADELYERIGAQSIELIFVCALCAG